MSAEPPAGWVELETGADWTRVHGLGGVLVISDDFTDGADAGPKYHERGCSHVERRHFMTKVVEPRHRGGRPNGRYFWVASEQAALDGGAHPCELASDPVNW